MKKKHGLFFGNSVFMTTTIIAALLAIVLTGCVSTSAGSLVEPVVPKAGESLIIIERKNTIAGAAMTMHIWIDDVEQVTLKRGEIKQVAIADGQHTVQAGSSRVDMGEAITITVTAEEVSIFGEPQMGAFGARFKLTETGRKPL